MIQEKTSAAKQITHVEDLPDISEDDLEIAIKDMQRNKVTGEDAMLATLFGMERRSI